jgi:hypothetical protein
MKPDQEAANGGQESTEPEYPNAAKQHWVADGLGLLPGHHANRNQFERHCADNAANRHPRGGVQLETVLS